MGNHKRKYTRGQKIAGAFAREREIAKWFRRDPSRGATVLSRIPCRESVRQEIRDSWVGIEVREFLLITLSINRYQEDQFRAAVLWRALGIPIVIPSQKRGGGSPRYLGRQRVRYKGASTKGVLLTV